MSAYTRHEGPEPFAATLVGGINYRLDKDLVWHIGAETGPIYTVPAGFVFNVSTPLLLRWAFDPHDHRLLKAACLHDHMLSSGWSRITAAAEFHNAMKADGVALWKRLAAFIAVALWKFD